MNTMMTCPICEGTGKVLLTDEEKKHWWYANKTHKECTNCGGQRMFGHGTGKVNARSDGTPCIHVYDGSNPNGWNCYIKYTCIHCGDRYEIDSSG